jgi:septum formation protein
VPASPRLVLASGSPRRRELLSEAGFELEVVAPAVFEISNRALTLREITLCNATRKGLAVARAQPGSLVLGADTLIALDDEVIGKPADLTEATLILRRLSGRTHEVCSAVFICNRESSRTTTFHEISHVRFRRLSKNAIRDYITRVNPLDKAGAYGAQGHGAEIIAQIDGSFTNVVGLPMEKTIAALRAFGLKPRLA